MHAKSIRWPALIGLVAGIVISALVWGGAYLIACRLFGGAA